MTPLAYELLGDLTTPGAFKCGNADGGDDIARQAFWYFLNESRFFDVSACAVAIEDVAARMKLDFVDQNRFSRRLAFLPSPYTWIETIVDRGGKYGQWRIAMVVSGAQNDSVHCAMLDWISKHDGTWYLCPPDTDTNSSRRLPLCGDDFLPQIASAHALQSHFELYAALAFINSPRVIGRRQHMPHERIEREQLKLLGLVGKFALRPWTEIILKVAPPDDRTGEPSTEAHLTGERCLHFCRTHLRVRLGQLEYVEGHWRGNPALGMKRSRYRVTP